MGTGAYIVFGIVGAIIFVALLHGGWRAFVFAGIVVLLVIGLTTLPPLLWAIIVLGLLALFCHPDFHKGTDPVRTSLGEEDDEK